MTPKFPPVLIGEPEALLLLVPLKIKDNVDHAGLSQLLDPLKEPPLSMEKKNSNLSLNPNLLIAHHLMEMKDAMEDLWTMPSNMFKNTVLLLKLPIPTNPPMENAKPKEELSKSPDIPMSPKEMPRLLLLPVPNNPSQLPLMPTTSNSTTTEFSLIAKTNLITE